MVVHCRRSERGYPPTPANISRGFPVKKLFFFVLIGFFYIALSFVAQAQDLSAAPRCDVKTGLDAAKFFIYFTQDTPYTSWQLWPGKEKLHRGKGPHGAFLTTYVNPAAYRSITGKSGMSFGSLIVLEDYDSDKKLGGFTVMLKIKGYNPPAGDWHWFQYASDGKVLAAGRVDACIHCHSAKKDNDYIMSITTTGQ